MLKYKNKKYGWITFSIIVMIFALLLFAFYLFRFNNIKSSIKSTVKTDLNAYTANIDNQIAFVASDMLLLEDIITNKQPMIVIGDELLFRSNDLKQDVIDDIMDWITVHNIYDHIRILGPNGDEILRVNNNQGSPYLVPDGELQNKADRYYFQNSINLPSDVLYMSKIDLNIENGEIELIDGNPKEMLRLASTIYDEQNDLLGLIVVNYFADRLFHDEDTQFSDFTEFEVINDEGYYLNSSDASKEYGFMYEDKIDETFSKYYEYDILSNQSNELSQTDFDQNLFTYIVINNYKMSEAISQNIGRQIDVYSDNGDLLIFGTIVIRETEDYIELNQIIISLSALFLLISYFIAKLLDEIKYVRKKELDALSYASNYDVLTGLNNRYSIFKQLEQLSKHNANFTILFLDLNKFKAINDNYGHNIGDQVLIESGKRFKSCISDKDILSRLGGDEFLIILKDNVNAEKIDQVKKCIKEKISHPFVIDDLSLSVGVSIGSTISDQHKDIEKMIHEADQYMYQDKNND